MTQYDLIKPRTMNTSNTAEQPRPTYTGRRSWLGQGITHPSERQSRVMVTQDGAAALAKYKQVTGSDEASRCQGAL